jgi:hypothetical protein
MAEDKALYKNAFWLYGVIVGLAIKEALETTVPHLMNIPELSVAGQQINFPHPQYSYYPEFLRLIVFLALIIRFYLGSAYFFTIAHEADSSNAAFKEKYGEIESRRYGLDFVFGFVHFLGFIILALTIDLHHTPVRWFDYAVVFILLYDALWYAFTFKLDTSGLTLWWMVVNGFTFILCGFIYLAAELSWHDPIRSEIFALWPVLMISGVDIGWMMLDKPFFEPVRDWLTRRGQRKATAAAATPTEPPP